MSRLPVGSSARMMRRLGDQRAGDGDALLLSAGELARLMIEAIAEADALQRRDGQRVRVALPAAAVVQQRQLDVLHRAGARQEIEALEDEADLLVADRRERVLVERRRRARRRAGTSREVGVSRQPRTFISVDLPEPEVPMIGDELAAARRSRSMPRSACTSFVPARVRLDEPVAFR